MFEDYRAVSIRHSARCCRAASALDGKRFLSTNAPSLPLANCSMPGLCSCDYRTLADRREDEQPTPPKPVKGWARLFGGRGTTDTTG
jgi:hypothetical protein